MFRTRTMFKPTPLKEEFSSYAPAISQEIMEVHYTKHYLGYLNNLNHALSKHPELFSLTIAQILEKINEIPEDIKILVRNNGGGVVNHEILWETISTSNTEIHEGSLKKEIEKSFGNWETFIQEFKDVSLKLFGSGWVWLTFSKDEKKLKIIAMPNQDSPYMMKLFPLFGIDVWEHAYYLQYKNVRKEYIENFMKIIDWVKVEQRFLSAI